MNAGKKYSFVLGIDPGVSTGIAVWDKKKKQLVKVETMLIHDAMAFIRGFVDIEACVFVRVEDSRQRKWIPQERDMKQRIGRAKGAGSVSRDCVIWQDFLISLKIDFEMVAPRKGLTKYSAAAFKKLTKYEGRTSSHGRDASLLIFGY
jgi:hypothetical protein